MLTVFCNPGPDPLPVSVTPAVRLRVAGNEVVQYDVMEPVEKARNATFEFVPATMPFQSGFVNAKNGAIAAVIGAVTADVEETKSGETFRIKYSLQGYKPGTYSVVLSFQLFEGVCQKTYRTVVGVVDKT